jgi:hypothetical protein
MMCNDMKGPHLAGPTAKGWSWSLAAKEVASRVYAPLTLNIWKTANKIMKKSEESKAKSPYGQCYNSLIVKNTHKTRESSH